MNEQLQKELAAWLTTLRDAAQQGAGFALEQAPLVVQEKVAHGRVSETLLLVVFVLAVALGSRAAVWGYRYESDGPHDDTGGFVMGSGAIAAVVAAILSVAQMFTVTQVWIAPRLYVIEWLAGLLK